jgi:Ca2+-binding EF-hand superfamily protein
MPMAMSLSIFFEFLSIMATIGAGGGEQMLIDEFRAFDKNVDGLISVIELKYATSKLS